MFRDDDIEKIIQEIEKRPALYDRYNEDYRNISFKTTLWEEVCSTVLPNWEESSKEYKAKAVQELKKKWLNLRTCFSREIGKQKCFDLFPIKRRKYIFYEKLLFLLPSMEKKLNDSGPVSDEDNNQEDEYNKDVKFEDVEIEEEKIDENKPQIVTFVENFKKHFEEPPVEKVEKKYKGWNGDDEDVHFVLSLVSMLKGLDRNTKLEAKIQILRVFQQLGD